MRFGREKTPEELGLQMENAEKVLGTDFLYDKERTKESLELSEKELVEKYPYRYEQYGEILRELALKRKVIKRKADEENLLEELERDENGDIKISAEDEKEMQEKFMDARKYILMTNNLEEYKKSYEGEEPQGSLREHQQNCMDDIENFFNRGGHAGKVIMHTGAGKTAIFSELSKALCGTGEKKELNPIKIMILTSKIDLVRQTVGLDSEGNVTGGLSKFTPSLEVTSYYSKKKDLTGTVVVSTYNSFNNLMENGKIDPDSFDLIICDEAHKALGEKTGANLRKLIADSVRIGFTATGSRFEEEKNKDLFPEEIHRLCITEGMEIGTAAPARGFRYKTGVKFDGKINNGDYTQETLQQLDQEARNRTAIDMAKSFIEGGRGGLISCLPGDNLAHAKKIAEMLNAETIIDLKTGEERNIRVQYVGGKMKDIEREAYYKAFEKGEIDCLTFVDILTEGWDSTTAKFLINLRPTMSPDLAEQRFGRILRPAKDGTDAVFVEFQEDNRSPNNQPYTIFNVLGVEEFKQGERVIQPNNEKGKKKEEAEKAEKPLLPKELLDKLDIKTEVVTKFENIEAGNIENINMGTIKINGEIGMTPTELANMYGIQKKEVESLIGKNNIEPIHKAGKRVYYSAEKIIDLFLERKISCNGAYSITDIGKILGMQSKELKQIVEERNLSFGYDGIYPLWKLWEEVKKIVATERMTFAFLLGDKGDIKVAEELWKSVEDPETAIEIIREHKSELPPEMVSPLFKGLRERNGTYFA